jgi:hypothetical protein
MIKRRSAYRYPVAVEGIEDFDRDKRADGCGLWG